jgi:hypothetical protein
MKRIPALWFFVCAASMALATDKQSNIVWMVNEDPGPEPRYGDACARTPNIDWLAEYNIYKQP